ncbi:MAG: hypothetical protein PHO27_12930 [Sulfuricurvum sp.]|jgi:hypothetical protein|nr:hypothetical protein [Sulfuricurvum sp.]
MRNLRADKNGRIIDMGEIDLKSDLDIFAFVAANKGNTMYFCEVHGWYKAAVPMCENCKAI